MASSEANAPAPTGEVDYGQIEVYLESVLQEALRKYENGRVYEPENERVRIKWGRLAKDAASELRKNKEASDLAELTERIEELEGNRDVS